MVWLNRAQTIAQTIAIIIIQYPLFDKDTDKASEHSTMFSDTTIRALHNAVRAQLIVTTEVPFITFM